MEKNEKPKDAPKKLGPTSDYWDLPVTILKSDSPHITLRAKQASVNEKNTNSHARGLAAFAGWSLRGCG